MRTYNKTLCGKSVNIKYGTQKIDKEILYNTFCDIIEDKIEESKVEGEPNDKKEKCMFS